MLTQPPLSRPTTRPDYAYSGVCLQCGAELVATLSLYQAAGQPPASIRIPCAEKARRNGRRLDEDHGDQILRYQGPVFR
jgi:hypothetical protein